jgi:hemerythrin
MTIEWNYEKMTTGLLEIDNQHKEWIRRFNEFDNAVINQKGPDALQSTLSFLAQYTETHFALEEARMKQYNCPAQAMNLAAHNVFRGKLAEIVAWVKRGEVSTVEVLELKVALEEWLVNHICTIDVQLRGVVNSA